MNIAEEEAERGKEPKQKTKNKNPNKNKERKQSKNREMLSPRDIRSYTHEALTKWLLRCDLIKDDIDRYQNIEGENLLGVNLDTVL